MAKKQNPPANRPTQRTPTPKTNPKPTVAAGPPLSERLDSWLRRRQWWVLGFLVIAWIAIRVSLFSSVTSSPLYQMYKWKESDNAFFDQWARTLAGGDWLNRQPLHPYHLWHKQVADAYFQQHPERQTEILAANPGRDSTFDAGKVLWNDWYGGNTYHQEPLYPYVLAFLYALTGNGVYWMLALQCLLGVLSGLLLWLIARRYFGDTAALLTGLFYLFSSIILFQEIILLRTTWFVFFALLTVWMLDRALQRRTGMAFFGCGLSIGLAFLTQSTFLLFLLGALGIVFFQEKKQLPVFGRQVGAMLGGFMLVFSPVIIRNGLVGAPLFSTSSVGAITFAASNLYQTRVINAWVPNAESCAEIMGKTDGKFGAAVFETLKTHPSVGSYLDLMANKLENAVCGLEWSSNENFYFYRAFIPTLRFAFMDFYWILWLGAVGFVCSVYYRKQAWPAWWAILVQIVIILTFYIIGRFRTPLAALLLPFMAYGLLELFRFAQRSWKESLGKWALAAACFYVLSYQYWRPNVTMLRAVDYRVLYDEAFFERVKTNAEAKNWPPAIAAHTEFMRTQPDFVRKISGDQILNYSADIEILNLFAGHYQLHSFLYEDSGNKAMAEPELKRSQELKRIVERSRQFLNKK